MTLSNAQRVNQETQIFTKESWHMGLDIGSTTIKLVLFHGEDLIYQTYRRHNSDIKGILLETFREVEQAAPGIELQLSITGSGGVLVAEWLDIPFVQEVIAETKAIQRMNPEADVIIELGGEDAKITYLHPTPEQRMNGTCAGGTGSFIDQMAQLLQTDVEGLNELASRYQQLYPIASRCGVFAKSDLQPLLNEGAAREDLAASVLQAVVTQTVAGLSQGRLIKGNVVFLGGPLHFMPELRHAFERTLIHQVDRFILPENAQLYVAIGAAMLSTESRKTSINEIIKRFSSARNLGEDISHIPPLFADEAEYSSFKLRHDKARVEITDLADARGPLFFGLDAGSTTTKAVLMDENGNLVFSHYQSNEGSPVNSSLKILRKIYADLPDRAYIARACATGYGEALLKTALNLEEGEIETMAHYQAAEHFLPGVDFIVDIGGQDMKCMRVHDGIIDSIMLNEACSSGCGSFIQTFAHGLGLDTPSFAQAALQAKSPVDLGTRCTVFMNSRVKQAQKEGATVGDISAGLSYSVVRNALYKVIKIRDPEQMGQRIVVQGGTFLNDAILRSFEQVSGREVIRPSIAGLMGAFGCALIARNHWDGKSVSQMLMKSELDAFRMDTEATNCKLCGNHCNLTINRFTNGQRHISGNRCERGAGNEDVTEALPNLFDYKYKRTFAVYKSLAVKDAPNGIIGIPRVLNMYENYPLWFTIFTELGFRVQLSARSTHQIFDKGIDSIPSESVCYPAKLTHGHVKDLLQKGIKLIFYPDIPYEQKENDHANNHFNCPIVTSYPEVLKNNVDELQEPDVTFLNPFLGIHHPKALVKKLLETMHGAGFTSITADQMQRAVDAGYEEYSRYKEDILDEGLKVLKWVKDNDKKAIVLAGRPYHIDPEINHGIPELINSLGMAVLTEDAVARPGKLKRPIRVVDQWMYHTRLYEAAATVAEEPNLELVQLNSFGCGLDAVTTDQTQEILEASGDIYTCLKIDEVSNLGAARIRLRSLKVAMEERARQAVRRAKLLAAKEDAEQSTEEMPGTAEPAYVLHRAEFTKEMVRDYTILAPQMAPTQFRLVERVFNRYGYKTKILETASKDDIEVGLKYVHNDACFPTILVVGQLINALQSGAYDVNKTALMVTQTGGGCRATNYVAFLRKALKDAGMSQVPVIALSVSGIETNSGMKYSLPFLHHAIQAIVLGDLMSTVLLRVRPYELEPGSANRLYESWMKQCEKYLSGERRFTGYNKLIDGIVEAFDRFPMQDIARKPRVGIVGEILVKFQPDANNNVVGVIEEEGCEAVMPGLTDFFLYSALNPTFKADELGNSRLAAIGGEAGIQLLETYRKRIKKRLADTGKFAVPEDIHVLAKYAQEILSLGNATGEGWFLTAEMVELIREGVPNIIMASPFACLPNHVTGKGMVKGLRRRYPMANIVPIDYDPGASEVNQLNRIKLMISTAFTNEPVGLANLNEEDRINTAAAIADAAIFLEGAVKVGKS
ncbi:MAG: 2-hydroxyglutaryl-CoA dehydratase [Clostridia bacterium]|nr:2-hydroxyglutaryl-CoA dehydratase [Clostridia bacterium]